MRLGCALVLIAAGMLYIGGQGVYMGLVHRECRTVSYQEFVKEQPQHGWFEIKGCRLNLLESKYRSKLIGGVKEVYIPVHSAGEDAEKAETTSLLLLTKDPKILETVNALRKIDKGNGVDAVRALVDQRDRIVIDRDVKGMLQYGVDVKSHVQERLAKLDDTLATDFVVLEEGKEPELGFSLFMLLGGLLLLGFLVLRLLGGNSPKTSRDDLEILPDDATPGGRDDLILLPDDAPRKR